MTAYIDHIVIAATDLNDLVTRFTQLTGVEPIPGGRHDFGTANALVPMSTPEGSYLELIGPDPEADAVTEDNFAIASTSTKNPRVAGWCIRPEDLGKLAQQRGTRTEAMSRHTPEGTTLSWRLIVPERGVDYAPVPFAIDWEDSPHPSKIAEPKAGIHSLKVQGAESFEVEFPVEFAEGEPYLELVLDTPKGQVNLKDI
ncbi:hypothetical protein CDES_01135 [Corynebacterium deserti GIMN1.010]|uniref:Glyoxalase-like domain-containing protein n=1 Tax=Corynebacterium deserti GIMN1.010 TaxID=931089 RepID=A0A0M4CVK4_9CORY|nr:VOC family protein [Corynebacterium deserti]ALC04707.1 hypothetical protein CDES_01135 [Corynebacterium deserti GIMN1.010]